MDDLRRVDWMWGRTFVDADSARTWLRDNGYTPDPEDFTTSIPYRYLSDELVAHVVLMEGVGGAEDRWTVVVYHGAWDNFTVTGSDDDDE